MTKMVTAELFASLPPEKRMPVQRAASKLIVLDDDPTGTQTVHGIPVLTESSVESLAAELKDSSPCCYLLTNTRAFPALRACAINREIGRNLVAAGMQTGISYTVVSRSDSTLRGHYPAETDALEEALGGEFSGTLIIPAFLAGGRLTINDTHYVADGDTLTPAGETEFARDASFGYRSSNLRNWVEEKSGLRIRASEVVSVSLADLRTGGPSIAAAKLATLTRGGVAIVNVAAAADLAVLTHALAINERAGLRYLFRTAGDFVAAYAGIAPRALCSPSELRSASATAGGLLVVGSYVGKTSAQLKGLFGGGLDLARIEISVEKLLKREKRASEIARCISEIETSLNRGTHAALFTSRDLVVAQEPQANLSIGETISRSLVTIVHALKTRPRWLIAKGGITSSDIATDALGIRRALVVGQALPGVPVWKTGAESKWPDLSYIIFPGNVGGPESLLKLVSSLIS